MESKHGKGKPRHAYFKRLKIGNAKENMITAEDVIQLYDSKSGGKGRGSTFMARVVSLQAVEELRPEEVCFILYSWH